MCVSVGEGLFAMFHNYLNNAKIRGFENYKYCSIDSSPIAVYISHPFWNQLVKLYPLWLAPNLLTLMGMLFVLGGFLLTSYYDYYLYASSDSFPNYSPVPTYVWLVLSIFTFTAHVLDGTDGKQARRTGTSGPTGELFDHGIDSWMTVPFTMTLFSVFGRADYSISAFHLMLVVMVVQFVFIVTHWEKYNTGILFLSWGYDASQYFLALMYLITYFMGGHKFWQIAVYGFTPAEIMEVLFYGGAFAVSIPMSLYNIYKSYHDKTGKLRSFTEAMLPLLSTVVLFATAILWGLLSPSNVLEVDPRAYIWLFGTIFSNIACRLIVAQMTNTRCEPFNLMLYPYILLAMASIYLPRLMSPWELCLTRLFAVLVTAAHVHFGASVVNQMCQHFKISAFTLKKPAA